MAYGVLTMKSLDYSSPPSFVLSCSSRLQPEYVSVIPMPTAGGGQNYVAAYGGPRIITAPQFRG